jgi:hypothetical protein
MKNLLVFAAALLFTATMAMSQQQDPDITTEPTTPEVTTPETPVQASHGQTVSEVARETRSGEIISEQARVKGETMKSEKLQKRDQKRSEKANRPVRPERSERPERPERQERPQGRP